MFWWMYVCWTGNLGESSKMVGETVFGFFLDGEEAQKSVIFGVSSEIKIRVWS